MRKKVELEFNWNWKAQMHSIIRLLEMGDSEGKKYAREELLELADKLDAYNENISFNYHLKPKKNK
tara:strand:+ start:556 stop:753 length:198 start_codon:yes stop_codon:yes gene_type:complete